MPEKKQQQAYAKAYYKRHRDAIRAREKERREATRKAKREQRAVRFEVLKGTMLATGRKMAEEVRDGSDQAVGPKPAA